MFLGGTLSMVFFWGGELRELDKTLLWALVYNVRRSKNERATKEG